MYISIQLPTSRSVDAVTERRTKSLPAEQIDHVRSVAKRIVDDEFAGNLKQAADKLGITYSTLYNLVSGAAGAGNVTLQRLSEHTGLSIDDLLGRAVDDPNDLMPIYGNIPGWEESAAIVRAAGKVPEWTIEAAAAMAAVVAPERATPEFVLDAAQFAARHATSRDEVMAQVRKLQKSRKAIETRALRKLEAKKPKAK